MSDLSDVKKRILKANVIEKLFDSIGCQNISFEQGGKLITAQLPPRFNSSNRRAVQCRLDDNLTCNIRNNSSFSGDIFNLVSFLYFDKPVDELQNDIFNAKKYICEKFNWSDFLNGTKPRKKSIIAELRKRKTRRNRIRKLNKSIDENILKDNFVDLPNKIWLDEGISYETQKHYGIGYDILTNRITMPIRNKFGELVGVKGRLLKDEDVTHDRPKYMYIYKCNQSLELFNYYIAQEEAKKKNELIIVEGEKSCMKFYQNGIYNVVGLGSSDISDYQKQMIYNLGMNINIVLAYDNDKSVEEIFKNGNKLSRRNVYYIYDTDELLPPKSAPIDCGIEVWEKLYNECKFELSGED